MLVLGGARSGKSAYAEGVFTGGSPVDYFATGTVPAARPTTIDERHWRDRIEWHRSRRPSHWQTLEFASARDVIPQLRSRPPGTACLVDDLGTWLTRVIDETGGWSGSLDPSRASARQLIAAVAERRDIVLVSPEVGLGVIPSSRAGSIFRDELGILNAEIAAVCDRVVLVVAGQPMTVK